MAKIFHIPTRMCITCKERDAQTQLFRLQCKDGVLQLYTKVGRSFYVCETCLDLDRKISKSLMRKCKSGDKDKLMNKLKEIIADGRKS